MPTETPDVLERLRAANLAPGDDPAPAWETTRRRLVAPPRRRPRRVILVGATAATIALAASFVISSGSSPEHHAPLGVLQAAAATAAINPPAARFSGYTAETRVDLHATSESPGTAETSWKVVRPVSATEFEGRLEVLRPIRHTPIPPGPRARVTPGVRHSSQREGDQIRDTMSWRQPYGTLFQGVPAFFGPGAENEPPVTVPTDPLEAATAVAAWAAGRVPAGVHPRLADLIRESGRSPIAEALNYAEDVLTAPRVSPAVRAAVYQALGRLAEVRVASGTTDPLGRPAAALIAEDDDGPTHTRAELLIDPKSSRVLAQRSVFTVNPGANEHRPAGEPPYGEGSQQTTYRYGDG
jgi:hypothetical protein